MLLAIALLAIGLAVLVKGADVLVAGAGRLAKAAGVSPMVIGLTVVAFGTASPELTVSTIAALQGQPAVAIGNAVGSVIVNIGLVLGLAAVLGPLVLRRGGIRTEVAFLIAAAALVLFLAADGLGLLDGIVLVVAFLFVTRHAIALGLRQHRLAVAAEKAAARLRKAIRVVGDRRALANGLLFTAIGIVAVIAGAKLFLDNAVVLAQLLGISGRVIGLTLLAIGTSLPELMTAAMAALRRQPGLAAGDIVGSNLIDLLAVLGIASIVRPLPFGPAALLDVVVAMGFGAALFLFAGRKGLSRFRGGVLLAAYAAYVLYLFAG